MMTRFVPEKFTRSSFPMLLSTVPTRGFSEGYSTAIL